MLGGPVQGPISLSKRVPDTRPPGRFLPDTASNSATPTAEIKPVFAGRGVGPLDGIVQKPAIRRQVMLTPESLRAFRFDPVINRRGHAVHFPPGMHMQVVVDRQLDGRNSGRAGDGRGGTIKAAQRCGVHRSAFVVRVKPSPPGRGASSKLPLTIGSGFLDVRLELPNVLANCHGCGGLAPLRIAQSQQPREAEGAGGCSPPSEIQRKWAF